MNDLGAKCNTKLIKKRDVKNKSVNKKNAINVEKSK